MKRNVCLALLMLSSMAVFAQPSSTDGAATGDARVDITWMPLTLDQEEGFNFGTVTPSRQDGIVYVRGNDELSFENATSAGQGSSAKWTVYGSDEAIVNVTVESEFTVSDNEHEMAVDIYPANNLTGVQLEDGTFAFRLEGQLHVGAFQPVGFYQGTYEVTVQYQ